MWGLVRRFLSDVDQRGPDECWPWMGSMWRGKYGVFSIRGQKFFASRISYELDKGPIPKTDSYHGLVVMHKCDNPICVNPKHLRLGTQADNVKDMDDKGRRVLNPMRGEDHGMSTLTNAQVSEIRSSPESHSAIAKRFNTSAARIHYIRRKGWQHVDTPVVEYRDGRAERGRPANARLTDDDIRAIRASVEKPGIVAKRFNIIPDYVTMIRKRKVWKHVE